MKQFAVAILLRNGETAKLTQAIVCANSREEAVGKAILERQAEYPGYSSWGDVLALEVPSIDAEPTEPSERAA